MKLIPIIVSFCCTLIVLIAFNAANAEDKPPKSWMLFFDKGKYDLVPEARKIVGDAAQKAIKFPTYRLLVIGHDDWVLPREEALALSQQRAGKVVQYLIDFGVPDSRIFVKWVGWEDPIVPTAEGVAEPQNRFVEILFLPTPE